MNNTTTTRKKKTENPSCNSSADPLLKNQHSCACPCRNVDTMMKNQTPAKQARLLEKRSGKKVVFSKEKKIRLIDCHKTQRSLLFPIISLDALPMPLTLSCAKNTAR